jgi:hypothetical protein
MKAVFQVAVAVLAAFSMTACGGGVCERIGAADTKFFAGKSECTLSENGASITIPKGNSLVSTCNMSISKCTAADLTIIDSFTKCLEAAPVCTTGAEKAAVEARVACTVQLVTPTGSSKLSADCAGGIK